MVLLELFWAWFQIGLFSIGGGYAALPIIKNVVVDKYGWLTIAQFADLVVIDELAPGPIILNSATFVGSQVAGLPGAVVSTFGCIAGPSIIISAIAYFYFKHTELPAIKTVLSVLRPMVTALIASAGLSIIALTFWGGHNAAPGGVNFVSVAIAAAAFAALRRFKPNPVFVMMGCGIAGGVIYALM